MTAFARSISVTTTATVAAGTNIDLPDGAPQGEAISAAQLTDDSTSTVQDLTVVAPGTTPAAGEIAFQDTDNDGFYEAFQLGDALDPADELALTYFARGDRVLTS